MRLLSTSSALASSLARARLEHHRLTQVEHMATTLDGAYACLTQVEALMHAQGHVTVGYKIGATSPATQQRMELREPFWGPIFKQHVVHTKPKQALRYSMAGDMIRGVEAEFVYVLGKDLGPGSEKCSGEELVSEYCSKVLCAVEVCASRLPSAPNGLATICDGAGNGWLVMGSPLPNKNNLASMRTSVKIDGQVVAEGSGAEVLGDPAHALKWFVDEVVLKRGLRLAAGSFVTTGATCGLVVPPQKGIAYVAVDFAGERVADLCFRA
jgi:2-keto-4-pentenoate hydratase